ncbi:hypothetical protein L218DRAFT_942153 [Marasmius fiardii PR-910]|nr:hypothetical protein L218DRAFT_942153 [Marasmius fiardii PR-910]
MPPSLTNWSLLSLAALGTAQAYFLMGANNVLTTERIDPIANEGTVATHVHTVFGGSNFRVQTSTASLRQSECTSVPILEDHSNYWVPSMYFQWKNGSFSSVNGGAVIYYLYDGKAGVTTAFPDDFRMISGDPLLRTYDPASFAQQAITFLCLDFNGVTTKHNELPAKVCPSGVRAQVNFPMCWDGKNVDSPDHKSHVAFPSGGPDSGDCSDPKFPVRLPRIFMEMYWSTPDFKDHWQDAMTPDQPFVFSTGDRTGYSYHGDYFYGWKEGVLQKVVDQCYCDPNGSLDCCAAQGIFTLDKDSKCRITKGIDETTLGTLPKLPGNNPVQEEGTRAKALPDSANPRFVAPIYVYRGDNPDQVGSPVDGTDGPAGGGGQAGTGGTSASGTDGGGAASTGTAGSGSGSGQGGSNGGNGNTNGGNSNGQSTATTTSSSPASPPTPPPNSGSNNGNTGSGNSGTGSTGSSNSSSGGTSGSGSQSGSGSRSCRKRVKKRSLLEGKRHHGNALRKRFHSSDF